MVRSSTKLLRTGLAVLHNSIIQYHTIAIAISVHYIIARITLIPVVYIFNEVPYAKMTRQTILI